MCPRGSTPQFPDSSDHDRFDADLLNLPLYGSQAAASGGIGLGSPNNPARISRVDSRTTGPMSTCRTPGRSAPISRSTSVCSMNARADYLTATYRDHIPRADLRFQPRCDQSQQCRNGAGGRVCLVHWQEPENRYPRRRWHLLGQPVPIPALSRPQRNHASRQRPPDRFHQHPRTSSRESSRCSRATALSRSRSAPTSRPGQ